ncbi:MAG: Tn3 family transposase [Pyrinomonadaceae bacterium]
MPLLKILSSSEIAGFDSPPVFNHEERKKFFNLPSGLKSGWETLRTDENKILFLLQFGYFRACQRFFAGHFHLVDFEYLSSKFNLLSKPEETLSYSRPTMLRHQHIILEFCGVRYLQESDETLLLNEAKSLVASVVRPEKVFWQLVEKITALKIVVPSYFRLTSIISKAIQTYENHLHCVLKESLNNDQKDLLDSLLNNDITEDSEGSVGLINLTSLKQPFHSLKATHLKANLNDWQFLQSIYQNISPVINKLALTPEAIRFYANIVLKTKVFYLTRRRAESRYLYLLAFVAHQTFRLQDMLVDALLQSVQNTVNSANYEYRQQYFQKRVEQRRILNNLLESLQTNVFPTFSEISQVLSEERISDAEKLSRIESSVNENIIERQRLETEIKQLAHDTADEQEDTEFYAILQKKSLTLQRRAADIVRFLNVDEKTANPQLFDALRNFQNKDGNIDSRAPQEFLSSKEKELMQDKRFSVSLYKALLFQNIAQGIKSGTVNFAGSNKYRSLDDYLITSFDWTKSRENLLEKSDLQNISEPAAVISKLAEKVDRSFRQTNQNEKTNQYLQIKEQNSWTIATPKEDSEFAAPLRNYFPTRQVVALSEVLSTVNQASDFLGEFTHLQSGVKRLKPPNFVFFAGITALGCELGIPKITYTSKQLGETELQNAVNWFFTLENLRSANTKMVDFLASMELPNIYRRNLDRLHTSSDGQKYEVSLPSLNANYSFKYFGQNKGVSVYSFIDERHLLFYSTVISSSEREAAYVIDGLLHNEVIKSDVHSTDSHGFTEVVFAVTHLLGLTFAPRLKQFSKQRLYSFEKRKIYENLGFKILPKLYIDTKLIKDNWDDILRLVATIKLKYTTASQLFKRLNSYSNQHPLYQALKEFGKIIKTLFILRYVDDVELRQSIEKQLNKIEHAHRFAKAIAFGSSQEITQAEKEDQDISAECRRLIENSIICWNYLYLTHKLTKADKDGKYELLRAIKEGSIITWRHINFHGEYDFSEETLKDSVGFDLPEILSWKLEEKRE